MTQQIAVKNPFAMMAGRLAMEPAAVETLMKNTLMKAKGNGQVSNEELLVFMSIANEYKLNPLSKEVYAFNNRGAIQPIVSIDGWLKIINQHPQFDGMEFKDSLDANGALQSVTCLIYRKDRSRPTEVTEYMNECKGTSEPWKKWPGRMLRHKATIQAARYAFGLSGIVDPDEAERMESTVLERDITPAADITPALQAIQNAQTMQELNAAGVAANEQHPQHRSSFVDAYNARKAELIAGAQAAATTVQVEAVEPVEVIEAPKQMTEAELKQSWEDFENEDIPGI